MKFNLIVFLIAMTYSINLAYSQDYIPYHKNCRKAELYYLDGNVDSCLEMYNTLFESYNYSFPRDLYIAAQIASAENKLEYTDKFLRKAINAGVTYYTIRKHSIFNKFIESSYWINLVNDSATITNNYFASIDTLLFNKTVLLMQTDQSNITKTQYSFFGKMFNRRAEKKYYEINAPVFDSTIKLIKKHGYLGSKKIGIGRDSSFIPVLGNRNLSNHMLSSILFHDPLAVDKIEKELRKALINGDITPIKYALIIDFQEQHLNKKIKKFPFGIMFSGELDNRKDQNNNIQSIGARSLESIKQLKTLGKEKKIDFFYNPLR
jgi:hypothetical protein